MKPGSANSNSYAAKIDLGFTYLITYLLYGAKSLRG